MVDCDLIIQQFDEGGLGIVKQSVNLEIYRRGIEYAPGHGRV